MNMEAKGYLRNTASKIVLVSLLFAFCVPATIPTASADVTAVTGSSCSVSTSSQQDETCTFTCFSGGTMTAAAAATMGTVTISGSCGGASVKCESSTNACHASAGTPDAG